MKRILKSDKLIRKYQKMIFWWSGMGNSIGYGNAHLLSEASQQELRVIKHDLYVLRQRIDAVYAREIGTQILNDRRWR